MMAQVIEFLPPLWEARIVFLVPGYSLASLSCCGRLESESVDRSAVCLLLPLKQAHLKRERKKSGFISRRQENLKAGYRSLCDS